MPSAEDAANLVNGKLKRGRPAGGAPHAVVSHALIDEKNQLVITGKDLAALLPFLQQLSTVVNQTTDPHVAGSFWNNNGVICISNG